MLLSESSGVEKLVDFAFLSDAFRQVSASSHRRFVVGWDCSRSSEVGRDTRTPNRPPFIRCPRSQRLLHAESTPRCSGDERVRAVASHAPWARSDSVSKASVKVWCWCNKAPMLFR